MTLHRWLCQPHYLFPLAAVVLLVTATTNTCFGNSADAPRVTQIFSELQYTYKDHAWYRPSREAQKSALRSGSGFLMRGINGSPVVVTAAHVICDRIIDSSSIEIAQGETVLSIRPKDIIDAELRVRVSNLSIRPTRIVLDFERDLALLGIDDDAVQALGLQPAEASDVKLKTGDGTVVWGFPGTTHAQLVDSMRVSSMNDAFFVLNKQLDTGLSGGPVLTTDGSLVGVVVRTTQKQARCVRVSYLKGLSQAFDDVSVDYMDGIDPRSFGQE